MCDAISDEYPSLADKNAEDEKVRCNHFSTVTVNKRNTGLILVLLQSSLLPSVEFAHIQITSQLCRAPKFPVFPVI